MAQERKKQTLLTGAGVLAIATVVVKLIGALYKIPLTNLITVEGYGYFTGAYAVYTPLYAISMAGLPVAVAKLVSQSVELGRIKDAQLIFKIARRLFMFVGIFGTFILMIIAIPYSNMVGSPQNYISILTVAPCVMFCCQMSSFRGYYEGLKNMTPTGISQVIEAAGKLIIGLSATYICFNSWITNYRESAIDGVATVFGIEVTSEAEALSAMYPYAAAVAILGVTLGSLFGFVYLYLNYRIKGFGFTREEIINSPEPEDRKVIRNRLIKIATPIAISSLILNISNMIDDTTIRTRLEYAIESGGDIVKNMYEYSLTASQTLDSGIANYLYGTHGSVLNIKNLIPTITMTLGVSAIPAIASAWAKADKKGIKITIESVLRVTMLIAIPAGIGMFAMAEPILQVFYGSQEEIIPIATPLLKMYGLAIFLFAVASPITNMLQALGRTDIPLKSVFIGSIVKITLNYILIGNPYININGAPISTIICYIVMVSINLTSLLRITKTKIDFKSILLKPLVAGIACGVSAYCSYTLFTSLLPNFSETVFTIAAIGIGGCLYAVVLVLVKGIAKDDLDMIPKGEKIAKTLAKFNLLG